MTFRFNNNNNNNNNNISDGVVFSFMLRLTTKSNKRLHNHVWSVGVRA